MHIEFIFNPQNSTRYIARSLVCITLLVLTKITWAQSSHLESFDYPIGEIGITSKGKWIYWGIASSVDDHALSEPIQVLHGSLSHPQLSLPKSKGNKIQLTGDLENSKLHAVKRGVDDLQYNRGEALYLSFLMNVTRAPQNAASRARIFAFKTDHGGPLGWLQIKRDYRDEEKYQLGVSLGKFRHDLLPWSKPMAVDQTYFLVIKYDARLGIENDRIFLWVDPTPGGNEADRIHDVGYAYSIHKQGGGDWDLRENIITGFGFSQERHVGPFLLEIDEVRIGSTYGSVTPRAVTD